MKKLAVVFMLLFASCESGGQSGGSGAGGVDIDYGWPEIEVRHVLSGLNKPTNYVHSGDGTERTFLTEQYSGKVIINNNGKFLPVPFLDIGDRLIKPGSLESGLLGIAFSPNYKTNGYFYLNYVGLNHRSIISRFKVTGDPNIADPASEEIIMVLEERYAGHHYGGQLAFGPDGYLYIGVGDGSSESPVSDPNNVAQNKNSLLGKILRIDVEGQKTYAIPPDNPFVGQEGAWGEIWAYGLRNPWKFSFDRQTGDLYIGDVGDAELEAVYYQPASSKGGENYGWSVFEGSACYKPELDCGQAGITNPIIEYPRDGAINAVIGGYVYRGPGNCRMRGKYFYADYGSGKIWAAVKKGGVWETRLIANMNEEFVSHYISSFGEDEAGRLFLIVHWRGGVNDGEIYKIHDPSGPQDC